MSVSWLTEQYFKHGLDYYVSARYAALSSFSPVGGLLSHYAVEMFLKGRLSAGRTEKQLKAISHDLNAAWAAFKAEFPSEDLSRFDAAVAEIDRCWRVRYPESLVSEGMQFSVDWSGAAGDRRPVTTDRHPSVAEVPAYHLSLHDLDALVRVVFDLSSVNPGFFMVGMNQHARTYLHLNNEFFNPEDDAGA